jgi:hypothetical protein
MLGLKLDTKTTYRDRGAGRLIRQIESMGHQTVIKSGILSEQGRKLPRFQGKVDGKVNIAKYAWWQETGTRNIPRRPFMSFTNKTRKGDFSLRTRKRLREVHRGRITTDALLSRMGRDTKFWIQTSIRAIRTPANADSTLRNKRRRGTGSNPLIDSGSMLRSIRSEARKGLLRTSELTRLRRLNMSMAGTRRMR